MKNREIERKFLVKGDGWRGVTPGEPCRQGYVVFGPPVSVRVRAIGDRGYLTLKRASAEEPDEGAPVDRIEFEYEVPVEEALGMLDLVCSATIEKTRYKIMYERHLWEVDEFHGENAGLVVAEIELETIDSFFDKPEWVGEEVSNDPRYLNVNLSRNPYRQWGCS